MSEDFPQEPSVLENEGAIPAEPVHKDDLLEHPNLVLDQDKARYMANKSKKQETYVVQNKRGAIEALDEGDINEADKLARFAQGSRKRANAEGDVAAGVYDEGVAKAKDLLQDIPRGTIDTVVQDNDKAWDMAHASNGQEQYAASYRREAVGALDTENFTDLQHAARKAEGAQGRADHIAMRTGEKYYADAAKSAEIRDTLASI